MEDVYKSVFFQRIRPTISSLRRFPRIITIRTIEHIFNHVRVNILRRAGFSALETIINTVQHVCLQFSLPDVISFQSSPDFTFSTSSFTTSSHLSRGRHSGLFPCGAVSMALFSAARSFLTPCVTSSDLSSLTAGLLHNTIGLDTILLVLHFSGFSTDVYFSEYFTFKNN